MAELILTGSRALAGKYRRFLIDHHLEQPAAIWTWPDLLREVAATVAAPPVQLLSPIEESLFIREACLAARPQLQLFAAIADSSGFWSGIGRFISQVRQSGLSLESVVTEPVKTADLRAIVTCYEALLAGSGLTDMAGRYRALTTAVCKRDLCGKEILPGISGIHLIDVGAPNGVQVQLLEALKAKGVGYKQSASLIPAGRPNELQLITAAEPYGEICALADQVAALLSSGAGLRDTAVIYPDEQYLTLLRKEFGRQGIPLRASSEQALSSVPIIRHLLGDFQVQGGESADSQTHQDRFTRFITAKGANTRWQSELSENIQEDSRRLAAREIRSVDRLHELSAEISEALQSIYGDRPLSHHDYCEILSLSVAQTKIWQEPYPGPGLRCVPLAEAVGVYGRHFFFVGLSQQVLGHKRPGWLPEVAKPSDPTAIIDVLLTEGPVSAALSFSRADTGGRLQLRPLYFQSVIERWRPIELHIPYYQPGSDLPPEGGQTGAIKRKLAVDSARQSSAVTPWDGDLSTLSSEIFGTPDSRQLAVSRLESYRRCPFTYYAQYLLRLAVTDEEIGEVQAIDEGALVHEVLRAFYERVELPLELGKSAGYTRLLDQLLAARVSEQRAQLADILPGAWEISQHRLSRFLHGMLQTELTAAQTSDFRPVELEVAIVPLTLKTAFGEVTLRGRIDRVDSNGKGSWRLIDYKSGVVKAKEISDYVRLQLAIYAEAWRRQLAETGEVLTSLGVNYYSYKKGEPTLFEPKDLQDTQNWLTGAMAVVEAAAEGVLAGEFLPSPVNQDVCARCGFSDLCRNTGSLKHKQPSEQGGAVSA